MVGRHSYEAPSKRVRRVGEPARPARWARRLVLIGLPATTGVLLVGAGPAHADDIGWVSAPQAFWSLQTSGVAGPSAAQIGQYQWLASQYGAGLATAMTRGAAPQG